MDVPDSVRDYFHDGGIRHAINELLRLDTNDEVLPGLDWSELARYYEALAAAHRFRIDWLLFAQAAWDVAWSGLSSGWTPWSPHEQVDLGDGVQPTLANCCNVEEGMLWFGRLFDRDAWTLTASICAEPGRGLRLQVSCATDRAWEQVGFGELADETKGQGFSVSRASASLAAATVDLSALQAAAEAMLADIDRQIAAGFENPRSRRKRPVASPQ